MSRTFPYGNTYVPGDCNGNDYLTSTGGTAAPIPTGSDRTCVSIISTKASTGFSINPSLNYSIFDMSGNVKEWTATESDDHQAPQQPELHHAPLPVRAARAAPTTSPASPSLA